MKRLMFIIFLTYNLSLITHNSLTAQWVKLNSGTTESLSSFYFTDSTTGYAVGSNGIIIKTTDAGVTWIKQNSETTTYLFSIQFFGHDTGFVVGSGPWVNTHVILKTTNGGKTWITLNSGFNNYFITAYFTDVNTGCIVCRDGTIIKTTDGGETWIKQNSGTTSLLRSIYFPSKDTGYACGSVILKTTDGGNNWKIQKSNVDLYKIYFVDSKTGYAVGKEIYKTINGGMNWLKQNNPVTDSLELLSVYAINTNIVYAVGLNGIIMKTADGGNNWSTQNSGTKNGLTSIYVSKNNTGYIVGWYGTILKYNNIDTVSIEKIKIKKNELKIYPNPVKEMLNVEFLILNDEYVNIEIYDFIGNQVATLINQKITKGKYEIHFDATSIKNGIYFIKLNTNKITTTKKVLITH